MGTRAAATCSTPLSVASRLYCAAAFLVSCTSILIPRSLMCSRVAGEIGMVDGPVPIIRRSGGLGKQLQRRLYEMRHIPGLGQTSSRTPQASLPTSHCPLVFSSFPVTVSSSLATAAVAPSLRPARIQGRHRNASPPTSSTPLPLILMLLFKAKPSFVQASMPVLGGGALPNTFSVAKSVWVSSIDGGPRSCDFGGREALRLRELWRCL